VDSVFYALEAMTKPVVWIVGGVDKGNDYSPLFDLAEKKVKAVICMGKDNEKILNAFKNKIEIIVESGSMQEALKAASLYANSGDVVLLSPACASFDLFNNYQHRGNVFKEILSSAMAELENK
jgi:UDP-N-acetylmuramoylalanine--D-glutamate ligase